MRFTQLLSYLGSNSPWIQYVKERDSVRAACLGFDVRGLRCLLLFAAQAAAYHDNLCCSGVLSADDSTESEPVGQDSVQHSVLCEAEGLPQSYTLSTYICPNGERSKTQIRSVIFQRMISKI